MQQIKATFLAKLASVNIFWYLSSLSEKKKTRVKFNDDNFQKLWRNFDIYGRDRHEVRIAQQTNTY